MGIPERNSSGSTSDTGTMSYTCTGTCTGTNCFIDGKPVSSIYDGETMIPVNIKNICLDDDRPPLHEDAKHTYQTSDNAYGKIRWDDDNQRWCKVRRRRRLIKPDRVRNRRLMERLLRYETHYSSGA